MTSVSNAGAGTGGGTIATIYDVARAAGVSPKTVSRVMNNDGPVSVATRQLVTAAMARLRYVPSSAARAMRSHRTNLVGLVTGAISGPQAAGQASGLPDLQIVQGIQRALAEAGITLLISDTGGDIARVPQLVRTLGEHRVEGVFYVADRHMVVDLPPVDGADDGAGGRPDGLVLVNCFDAAGTPCVLPADAEGQKGLVRALLAAGHRRIGYLALAEGTVAHRLRLDGYRAALAEAGLPFDPRLVIDADRGGAPEERAALDAAIGRMLALGAPPTVLCCGNDRLAVAVYGLLRARGIAVPEQMSVAGFDDYRVISETLYPRLTTMELPYARMGEAAARLMLGALRGGVPMTSGTRIEVAGAVCWRDSVHPGPARTVTAAV